MAKLVELAFRAHSMKLVKVSEGESKNENLIMAEKFPHSPILHYASTSYNYAFYSLSLNTIDNSLGN